jgi:hypothetical protein
MKFASIIAALDAVLATPAPAAASIWARPCACLSVEQDAK